MPIVLSSNGITPLPARSRPARPARLRGAASCPAITRQFVLQRGVAGFGACIGASLGLVDSSMAISADVASEDPRMQSTDAGTFVVEGGEVRSAVEAVGFYDKTLEVGEESTRVSYWYPSSGSNTSDFDVASYTQRTSYGKLCNTFLRLGLPEWIAVTGRIRASPFVFQDAPRKEGERPAVVLAHGYLGSRYDLVHIAERLAALGFTVAAPEMPDARSGEGGASRAEVLQRTLGSLREEGFNDGGRVGLAGHSAGSGTIVNALPPPGSQYPRACIAGYVPTVERPLPEGPMLVVASAGDSLMGRLGGLEGMKQKILPGFELLMPGDAAQVTDAAPSPYESNFPDRAALFLERPNHVSFLSERSNDNMISQLGPLLPIARALGLRLLDFDKYFEVRDSRATAQTYLPTLEAFFTHNLGPLPK